MAWVHIQHEVRDFNQWKQIYDASAAVKRRYGWKRYRVYQVAGERTHLVIFEQFERLDQAQEYLASDFWQNALKQMGVVGTPQVLVLEGVEEGMA